jgi:predicted alpha/beta superfamily hydrolase
LAGLFVVETFLREPDLFDTYIAIDPSLWWNGGKQVKGAGEQLRARPGLEKRLYLSSSGEDRDNLTRTFADVLGKAAPPGVRWHHENLPEETHATVFHPAALKAFRAVFKPEAGKKR